MKYIIYIAAFLFALPAWGQILPPNFPKKATAEGTDEIYSQATGTAQRITFDTARTFFAPDIDLVALGYDIDSSGTNVVDSLRGRFVIDLSGDWWYVDYDKTAVALGSGGGSGSGETNTMDNVGDGTGIYYQKSGVQFQLKSLKGGGINSISSTDSTVTITATEIDGSTTNELDTLTFAGDSGTPFLRADGDTLTIAGAGIASTSASGSTITVTATEVDGSTTNELGTVSSITYVPDTTSLAPKAGDAFINTSADTLGLYSGTGWVLFYGGGGGSGTTDTYALTTYIADGTDTIDFSSQRNGYFRLSLNSWSYRDSLTFINPNSSIAPTYTLHIDSVDVDTIVFPSNLLDANRDAIGSRRFIDGALLSFFYDGTNYIAPNPVGIPVTVPGGFDPISFDVTMMKTATSTSPTTGDTVTFYLAVENTSATTAATNLTIKDYLPDSLSNVHSISDSGTLNGTSDTITWSIASIAAGVIDTLSFAAKADGIATNYAEITAVDQTESNTANNIDSVVVIASTTPAAVDTILNYTTGLQLYIRADSLTGLSDSDPVTSWPDLSSSSHDLSQGTGTAQPTYLTGQINSRPAVSFDGGDILKTASIDSWTKDTLTIVAVVYGDNTTGSELIVARSDGGLGKKQWALTKWPTTKEIRTLVSNDGTTNVSTRSDSLVTQNWQLIVTTANPSDIVIRKNGAATTELASAAAAIFDTTNYYTVGGDIVSGADNPNFNGDIALIAVWNTQLDSGAISEIETYINNEFSLW